MQHRSLYSSAWNNEAVGWLEIYTSLKQVVDDFYDYL